MHDIFISYAREDSARVESLGHALEAEGWSVFWDRSIPTGQTWQSHIGRALRDAKCVIVAWSKNSVSSSWVYEEADEGKQRGVLIPVLLEPIQPPIGFRSIQAADLSDWQPREASKRFEQLLRELKTSIARSPAQVAAAPAIEPPQSSVESARISAPMPQEKSPGKIVIASGVVVLAVAVLAYWQYHRPNQTLPVTQPTRETAVTETPAASEPSGAQKLTPVFGITPGVTTRQEIDDLIRNEKLGSFGTRQTVGGDKIEFAFAVIEFRTSDLEVTRNPFDTVTKLEYWGDAALPLGFRTQLDLEQAKELAQQHFVWLGTQSFRGLVFSTRKDGPILLEIGYGGKKNPLSYTIYGPL